MADNSETKDKTSEAEIGEIIVDPKDIPDIDSKYRFILLAAQRAKQIQRGANPRVELDSRKIKPTTIARQEFKEKKINFEFIAKDKVKTQ
jgi:DNA-directed RNA polymerase omega subunit